jgi:hypothetical protein
MVSKSIKMLFGLLAIILGAYIGLMGITYPVQCGTGFGCTTNQGDSLIAVLVMLVGINVVGIGGLTVWRAW